jgi:protein gp37
MSFSRPESMGKESRDPEAERDSVEASVFEEHAAMSETTGIQWTNATWNPWHGCHKISPGCKFCYMFRDKERYGQDGNVVRRSKTTFKAPLKWPETPQMCFTCSWSDWLIEEADAWREDAYAIIRATPHITYQILTKRIERALGRVPDLPLPNVWLGVSVENQKYADERVDILRRTPAVVRFVSQEPQLGRIEWTPEMLRGIDWLIVGGESGNSARAFNIEWARETIAACRAAGVAVFVKQMGDNPFVVLTDGQMITLNLRTRHGGNIAEWPEELRVREFPR